MKTFQFSVLVVGVAFASVCVPGARADDAPKAVLKELDLGQKGLLFDQWFSRFGYRSGRTVSPERNGVKFQIPPVKDAGMAGYYSSFELTGDFEVGVQFDIVAMPFPTTGYGASVGITVDSDGPAGSVALMRGASVEKSQTFIALRATPGASSTDQTKYEAWTIPTTGNQGRLVIRREKGDVVCLAADKPASELREVKRIPFTDKRIRYLKLHADCGGSPTGVTARLTNVRVRADEVVGGLSQTELDSGWSFSWAWVPVTIACGVAAYWLRVKRRRAAAAE